jgi:glycosyltransferase involved in cell wall biosynthesis
MRILVWSDLPMPSGFGRISLETARRLAWHSHKVDAVSLMYQDGPLTEPYYTWSAAPPRDLWATTVDIINKTQPEVIISCQDFPYHHTLYWGCKIDFSTIAWVVITPIDGTPVDEDWIKLAKIPDGFMVISKFGVDALKDVGVTADLCEPGIDFGEFHPATLEEKKELRRKAGLPEDAFIVASMMMNQGRKDICGTIEGFQEFCKDKPNALLYLDMEKSSGAGWDIPKLLRQMNVDEKRVKYKADIIQKLPILGDRYRISDIHSLLSFREGRGIPGQEAMACGLPSIMLDWCAGTEMCGDGKGCLVPIAKYANGKLAMHRGTWGGAFDAFPDLDEYVNILNRLYSDEGYRLTTAKKGYEWAKTLTWDRTAAQVEETMLNAVRKKKALPQPAAPREFIWNEPKSDVLGPGGENKEVVK